MKRAFSIVLALALVLTMMVASAAPAGAVSAGTVSVQITTCENVRGLNTTYNVFFHNRELLLGVDGDYIDVDFPLGTGFDALTDVDVFVGTEAVVKGPPLGGAAINTTFADPVAPGRTVRIYLDDGFQILKSQWVRIQFTLITNPGSCDYFLQVGTSNVSPEASSTYTIYSFKFTLLKGKNLFSLPAYPVDTSIEVVLADLFARAARPPAFSFQVWYWDAAATKWLKYYSDTSFNEITDIEPGKAYWIKPSAGIIFKFKGEDYPECQGPPQKFCWYVPSWNMVGFVSLEDMWASDYLKNAMLPWPHQTTFAVSTIYGFNSTLMQYFDTGWTGVPKENNAPGDTMLLSGHGYFMSFLADACIIPPIQ